MLDRRASGLEDTSINITQSEERKIFLKRKFLVTYSIRSKVLTYIHLKSQKKRDNGEENDIRRSLKGLEMVST